MESPQGSSLVFQVQAEVPFAVHSPVHRLDEARKRETPPDLIYCGDDETAKRSYNNFILR